MKTSGLDVHKDTIFCAIYNGKSYSEVTEFSTTTNSIRALNAIYRPPHNPTFEIHHKNMTVKII